MENNEISSRMRSVHATALFSMAFALVGFSYNVWRMEATEDNNSAREASFELLLQLAELEQLVFAAHYDHDATEGNPRKGWVKVGLINDLSIATAPSVADAAATLKKDWEQHWDTMATDENSAKTIVKAIDTTRQAVQHQLTSLD
jgi:hypothetical protein